MPRQRAEPILPCKAEKEYCTPPSFSSHMLSPILNDGNLYYRPGGGGAEKLFPEVEMQYLLTLQVSIYCMLALQSRVPPFSLHNSQLQLWRVVGGGGGLCYICLCTYL